VPSRRRKASSLLHCAGDVVSLWLACAVVVRGVKRWVWKVVVVGRSGYGLWVAVAVDGGGG